MHSSCRSVVITSLSKFPTHIRLLAKDIETGNMVFVQLKPTNLVFLPGDEITYDEAEVFFSSRNPQVAKYNAPILRLRWDNVRRKVEPLYA